MFANISAGKTLRRCDARESHFHRRYLATSSATQFIVLFIWEHYDGAT